MADIRLRSSQQAVLSYTGGKMGVSAVPGSGKTFTLSYLAAALVERLTDAGLADDQEVLIVTFTNPAVNSFRNRIAELVRQERGLLPYVGYRVRTLHGLAHDIVRLRPALVGLTDNFDILDERITTGIMHDLAEQWTRANGHRLLRYLRDYEMAEESAQLMRTLRDQGPTLVENIALAITRLGKDNGWSPAHLRARIEEAPGDTTLAQVGVDLYEAYQRALAFRSAVDFDDLVRLAMEALQSDPSFLARLQERWPYILEDEAQDSSKLQNDMLRLLSGGRNWVRVGDPNQAIYTTFTTADSNFLRQFLREESVQEKPLTESGRSCPAVIDLANYLVDWSLHDELIPHLHNTFYPQRIKPTEPGDPQPNPENGVLHIDWEPGRNITPDKEIERLVGSLEKWLPDHPDWTVAVLVPENRRGFNVVEALRERGIAYEELLRSTSATRDAAQQLQAVMDFLADPLNSRHLGRLFAMWWGVHWSRGQWAQQEDQALEDRAQILQALEQVRGVEDFMWPVAGTDWPDPVRAVLTPEREALLTDFRNLARFWLQASNLPADQLILTIAPVLFDDPADLALAHRMALVLRSVADNNPEHRLPQLATELRQIASNQRRFLGLEDAATGYRPRPGVVTVATMHAAKGLEWDRVYLLSINTYSFPAALPGDSFIAERWFIRDSLNIEAEAHSQAMLAMEGRAEAYQEGRATEEARVEYAAERLRLLYVGITRARRDLILMWNMGHYWEQGRENRPAQALVALSHHLKQKQGT